MACPTALLNYYVIADAPSGTRYTFVSDWQHASNPGSGVTQAFYDPEGSVLGYVPTLTSIDGRAAWHYAGIYVKCEKIVYYRWDGSIEDVKPVFSTVYTEGDVEEKCSDGGGYCSGCGNGGGGGSGTTPADYTYISYDPYDPAYSSDGSGGCGGSTDGSGGGDGLTCHMEYVYVEESDDDGITWHVIWEGWATVCE